MRRYERQIRTTLEDLGFLNKRSDRLRELKGGEKDFGALLSYLESTFGSFEDNMADGEGKVKDEVFAERTRRRAREERGGDPARADGKKVPLATECQSDEGLPPSKSEGRLKGFVRYRFFPMDRKNKKSNNAARNKAHIAADDLSAEAEGDLNIQVHPTYCKDIRQWGYGVWVKPTETFERKSTDSIDVKRAPARGRVKTKRGKNDKKQNSTFGSGGEVRGWTSYRGESRKNVSCPKCYAPTGYACVKEADVEIYKTDMKESDIDMSEVRRFRTNEHRERVDKYLETQGLYIKRDGKSDVGVFKIEEKEKPFMDSREEIRWLMNNSSEEALDEFAEAEDDGKLKDENAEIGFLLSRMSQEKMAEFVRRSNRFEFEENGNGVKMTDEYYNELYGEN